MSETKVVAKTGLDSQISALAGEFFVAAELLKREFQTSVTFGNAKAIDLLTYNPRINCTFKVQVKALRKPNYFLLNPSKVVPDQIYVFVLLNKPGQPVQYYIVPGSILKNEAPRFGKGYEGAKLPGILPKDLKEFADAWHYFESPV